MTTITTASAKRRRTNKRILTAAAFVAVFVVGLMAGGGGSDAEATTPAPTATVTASAAAAPSGALRQAREFTQVVLTTLPEHDRDGAKVISRGLDACKALADGTDPVAAVTPRFIDKNGAQPNEQQARTIADALKKVC